MPKPRTTKPDDLVEPEDVLSRAKRQASEAVQARIKLRVEALLGKKNDPSEFAPKRTKTTTSHALDVVHTPMATRCAVDGRLDSGIPGGLKSGGDGARGEERVPGRRASRASLKSEGRGGGSRQDLGGTEEEEEEELNERRASKASSMAGGRMASREFGGVQEMDGGGDLAKRVGATTKCSSGVVAKIVEGDAAKMMEESREEPLRKRKSRVANSSSSNISHSEQRKQFVNFVLDCDGVIWHGAEAIPGSIEALRALCAGKPTSKFHFVTNSSGTTRADIARKLAALGLHGVTPDQVSTSGSAAAVTIRTMFPEGPICAYVVGEQGLMEELMHLGIACEGGPDESATSAKDHFEFRNIVLKPETKVVCVGLDRTFNFAKLCKASLYLQRGCTLVATNLDAYDVYPPYGSIPGAGAIVGSIRSSMGELPYNFHVAGKPSGSLLQSIMKQRGMQLNHTVVVGDRVDTDIEFAKSVGASSCLVMTGVSTRVHAHHADFCEDSLWTFAQSCL